MEEISDISSFASGDQGERSPQRRARDFLVFDDVLPEALEDDVRGDGRGKGGGGGVNNYGSVQVYQMETHNNGQAGGGYAGAGQVGSGGYASNGQANGGVNNYGSVQVYQMET